MAVLTVVAVVGAVLVLSPVVLALRNLRKSLQRRDLARGILLERTAENSELAHHLRVNADTARVEAEDPAIEPSARRRGSDGRFLPHE